MIHTHPGQPQMQAEVILASTSKDDHPPLYTIRARYPRIIHAEVETHRVIYMDGVLVEVHEPGLGIMSDNDLSRNARSSRAVPVKTLLKEVRENPFVPWHWFKNQPGMQGRVPLTPEEIRKAEAAWLAPLPHIIEAVETMIDAAGLDIHKQVPNRLLESYMWIDTLMTATEWSNFLWLRNHEAAEPHLQDLARLIQQAIDEAEPQLLLPGEWHLPYITEADRQSEAWVGRGLTQLEFLQMVSAARCARISYAPFDGDASYERELQRYDSLVSSDRVHASPLEHQATPDSLAYFDFVDSAVWNRPELHGNLDGWIQYRKTVPGENHA